MILDMRGTIEDCNQSTIDMLGYSKNELIGKSRLQIHPNLKEDLPVIRKRVRKLCQGNDPGPYDHQLVRKEGTIIWVRSNSSFINEKEDQFIQIISEDITEKRKAKELIRIENEKLKQLDKMRTELIDRASHELKTPLVSIYGGIQVIKEAYGSELNKEVISYLDIIERGYRRLNGLVSNLIDSLRVGSKKLQIEKQHLNFSEILRNCIQEISSLDIFGGINIIERIPRGIYLDIDKIRIEQVFMNLLTNAIKFSPKNSEIHVRLIEEEEYIEVSIRDQGIGLTKEEKERLFTKFGKFERYDLSFDKIDLRNLSTEGSGLGLYITKELVEKHNGTIWAESEGRYKGTTFFLRLPK